MINVYCLEQQQTVIESQGKWMFNNFQKLNYDKSESVIFGRRQELKNVFINEINIGDTTCIVKK